MTLCTWRLSKARYAVSDFTGEGARLFGGRWNSIGVSVVYTSETLSLAALEIIAGGADIALLEKTYLKISATFDASIVEEPRFFPKGWDTYPFCEKSQEIGNKWVVSQNSIVLKVPSVVIPTEHNFVLNPQHPLFKAKVKISLPETFVFNSRLVQK